MPDGRGTEFENMADDELLATMTPAINSSIHANYYRLGGWCSVPWNIKPVERFMELNTQGRGKYYGEIIPIIVTDRMHILLWKNCDVSEGRGITFNQYVSGRVNGINTYFTRKSFWKLYFIRGAVEKAAGFPPESLRVGNKKIY